MSHTKAIVSVLVTVDLSVFRTGTLKLSTLAGHPEAVHPKRAADEPD